MRSEEPTDAELVEAFRHGDEAALGALFLRYQRPLYRLCYRMSRYREEALDLCQEAFLRIYRYLPGFEGRASFETWARRIAVNTCLTGIERRSRHDDALDDVRQIAAPQWPRPDALAVRNEELDLLYEAMGRLPDAQRQVFVLRELSGLSYQDIGDALGIPVSQVRPRLHRARSTVKSSVRRLSAADIRMAADVARVQLLHGVAAQTSKEHRMNAVEKWTKDSFDVAEIGSVEWTYSGEGPPSWRLPAPELERELDPSTRNGWWRMVLLMELRGAATPEASVLDIACGPGWPSIPLAPHVHEIMAVDASESALSLLQRNLDRRGIENVTARHADATDLPFEDKTFDVVVTSNFMDVVPTAADADRAAMEMLRVLKPGGHVVSWVQNFAYLLGLGDKAGKWRRSIDLEPDVLWYDCHFADLDPPHSMDIRFRGDRSHPSTGGFDRTVESTYIDPNDIVAELSQLRPALADQAEMTRSVEFVPDTAGAPFARAGFADVTVSPISGEMCVAFADALADTDGLPVTHADFGAMASALLQVMRLSDFGHACDISVRGRRPGP